MDLVLFSKDTAYLWIVVGFTKETCFPLTITLTVVLENCHKDIAQNAFIVFQWAQQVTVYDMMRSNEKMPLLAFELFLQMTR